MGVIKKVLHRDNNAISKPRHSRIFLDMEENIHIHYRDLRIELSLSEFEEFVSSFNIQSKELMDIIKKSEYKDGVFANANQDDVRIWTESKLHYDVAYHPRRISLEECTDGYHFHYRQYKILIDPSDFHTLTSIFKNLNPHDKYADDYESILDLINDNDIDFSLGKNNVIGKILDIRVAKYHRQKIRNIFEHIFLSELKHEKNLLEFSNDHVQIYVQVDTQRSSDSYRVAKNYSSIIRLIDFFRDNKNIGSGELNSIKTKIIDQIEGYNKNIISDFNINPESWLYIPATQEVIFPYQQNNKGGRSAADNLYRSWTLITKELDIGFVKPEKIVYNGSIQDDIYNNILETLKFKISVKATVDKIWVMGSAIRKQLGVYSTPFVHGRMAKLGSDIDLLIEINPDLEAELPSEWSFYIKEASNGCAVYHLGEINLSANISHWQDMYPNIEFKQHLIDAYIYFPSRGSVEKKESFISKFKAQLFYDRKRDGNVTPYGKEGDIEKFIKENTKKEDVIVEKMTVTTDNELYKVFLGNDIFILKLFKVSGNYHSDLILEHTNYEKEFILNLEKSNIDIAKIALFSRNKVIEFSGHPVLLFEYIRGEVIKKPEYDIPLMSKALAKMHDAQGDNNSYFSITKTFNFKSLLSIWLNYYKEVRCYDGFSMDITSKIPVMNGIYEKLISDTEYVDNLISSSIPLHNHGDVTPKNIITKTDGSMTLFDFNNSFYGPRIADIIDGAFEVSLAEKYINLMDFSRFDLYISEYNKISPLSKLENENINLWVDLIGFIKFSKEIRALSEDSTHKLRNKRACEIADYLVARAKLL